MPALYGLSRRSLGLALAMLAAMLSLGGVPPLAGFFAKLYVFAAAMGQRLTWLVVIGVLNSIIALYYYLMVVKYIFVDRSEGDEQPMEVAPALNFGLWVAVAGILILGVFAAPWYTPAKATGTGGQQKEDLIPSVVLHLHLVSTINLRPRCCTGIGPAMVQPS
jgi:NADH-quinone oxidoreductase subunit N